jgi:hypothetical protein
LGGSSSDNKDAGEKTAKRSKAPEADTQPGISSEASLQERLANATKKKREDMLKAKKKKMLSEGEKPADLKTSYLDAVKQFRAADTNGDGGGGKWLVR